MAAGSVNSHMIVCTGNRSASRATSQSLAAAPWHIRAMPVAAIVVRDWVCCIPPARDHGRRALRFAVSIADITVNLPRLTWPHWARPTPGRGAKDVR